MYGQWQHVSSFAAQERHRKSSMTFGELCRRGYRLPVYGPTIPQVPPGSIPYTAPVHPDMAIDWEKHHYENHREIQYMTPNQSVYSGAGPYDYPVNIYEDPAMHIPYGANTVFQPRPPILRPQSITTFEHGPAPVILSHVTYNNNSRTEHGAHDHSLTRRGPPLKPQQSGNAVWVGNIPSQPKTSIDQLREHFSSGFKDEIQSVFWITRSNCAFINYRSKEACDVAVKKFNQSWFAGARIVCRFKRNTAAGTDAHNVSDEDKENHKCIGRHDSKGLVEDDIKDDIEMDFVDVRVDEARELEVQEEDNKHRIRLSGDCHDGPETRYFILKSLKKEDLEHSVRTGIWETQVQNQRKLHEAFCNSGMVYLIFSANKSGEYFGLARMLSSPLDSTPNSSPTLTTESCQYNDAGAVVIEKTAETETAPKGRVVRDPLRNTLFWEAVHSHQIVSSDAKEVVIEPTDSQPFRIEWVSRDSVSFDRVRNMRNPWNFKKEVKVARDGTELETTLGQRIVEMFSLPNP